MQTTTSRRRIGARYELLKQIGVGGMGVVYHAHDLLTTTAVALKHVTMPDKNLEFKARTSIGRDGDVRLALAQEFKTLASLRHPHIISVLDYGFDSEGVPYYTMELLEGAQSLLKAGRSTSVEGRLDLLVQTLQALSYLHRRGIVHRDMKPANVLVVEDHARLVDFGLAVARDYKNPSSDSVVGTLAYIAPEVLQTGYISEAADIYAVGVMGYELFAGQYPFRLDNMTHLIEDVITTPPDVESLEISDALKAVLRKLLAKHPTDRYHDAGQVINDLLRATGKPIPPENTTIRESFLQAAQFVGRESELLKLTNALKDTVLGRGSAWLVGGESGVGKTRLLEEIRTMALVEGALVLRGGSVDGGGLPYRVWRDAVRRLLLSSEVNDQEAAILKEIVPDIAKLIGREVDAATPLDGEPGRQRLSLTIAELFKRQTQPVALLLEDLQWSAESLEPLKQLCVSVKDLPLLIVGTYRDEERPDLPDRLPEMTPLKLRRLSRTAIAELSASMLGRVGKSRNIVDLLQRETEGNTLFIIEVVRALAEDAGNLDRIGIATLPQTVVAGGIDAVIRRRLNHVPEFARSLLKMAAIIGRQIDLDVLMLLRGQLNLDAWLIICEGAAVLEVVDGHWQFTHDKLRETLLNDLSPQERMHLNHRVTTALERIHGDDDAWVVALAHHWQAAGDVVKAAQYAIVGGEQLLARSSYVEGRDLLLDALKLLPSGKHSRLQMALTNLLGEFYGRLSEYHTAMEYYKVSLQIARSIGDRSSIAGVLNGLAFIEYLADEYDNARVHSEAALMLAQAVRDDKNTGRALNNLGVVAEMEEDFIIAQEFYRQALMVFRNQEDWRGAASCLNNLGSVADSLGDYAEAQQYYQQSLNICRRMDYSFGVSVLLNNLGVVTERLDNPPAAHNYYLEGLRIARDIGDRRGSAHCLANMVFTSLKLGDVMGARNYLREALLLMQMIDTRYMLPHLLTGVALLRMKDGKDEGAAEMLGLLLSLPDHDSDFMSLRFQSAHRTIAAALPEAELEAALSRGGKHDLETVMQALLDEF